MAVVKLAYGAATALTVTGLATLASATGATSAAIVQTTDLALDNLVEIAVTVGTVVAPSTVAVYAVSSVDGTNFGDVTNSPLIGVLSAPTSATAYRKTMSVAQAFGGNLPPAYEIYVVNSTGAALTAGTAQYREITATVV